ncbi:MAG: hypothetical protein Q8933_02545 [Bacteroidota bacterium]|jgi:hypothetical protein|nr:hypothetical protein [Bacteroidota bacterium]MDP4190198.1 hypothetical protein [Bacteroidota bacterium]MDP4193797.1 hypothetical protein [Bacteroidota bacterium]
MHFAKCNNTKCSSIYLVDPEKAITDLGCLCPVCRTKVKTSHVVQCASCQTVINFIHAAPNEEKTVFYVEKCSHCGGTIEDEWDIEPLYTPESYI